MKKGDFEQQPVEIPAAAAPPDALPPKLNLCLHRLLPLFVKMLHIPLLIWHQTINVLCKVCNCRYEQGEISAPQCQTQAINPPPPQWRSQRRRRRSEVEAQDAKILSIISYLQLQTCKIFIQILCPSSISKRVG